MDILLRSGALSLCVLIVSSTDPCADQDRRTIPNLGYRYTNVLIDTTETPYHDSMLPESWYYVGKEPMPESPPDDIFTCGTKFPIWLQGKHPTNDDKAVKMTACVKNLMNNCSSTYDIQIKHCQKEGIYMYYLKPTTNAEQGYCFGIGIKGSSTSYVSPTPTATVELYRYKMGKYDMSTVRFQCKFTESKDALLYRVSWWRENKIWYNTAYASASTNKTLYLTEELFLNEGFRMGENIACSTRAFKIEGGPPGKSSETSDSIYVGIEILTPSLTFNRGEQDRSRRTIRLRPTVPIGCYAVKECTFWLTAYTNRGLFEKCSGVVLEKSTCGVLIESKTYNSVLQIPIITSDNGQYPTDDTYEIFLKTDTITSYTSIWSNYRLPPVKVHIPISKQIYIGKKCFAVPDPHLGTFDGLEYDNHKEGVFTLYTHTNFTAEMQIQNEKCYLASGTIMCPCGFAARAGKDRYVISVCNNSLSMEYKDCGDDSIVIKRLTDMKYKIAMPYGTYAEVEIQSNPYPPGGKRVLSIYVHPSVHDEARGSRGLCGQLDDSCLNDLHDKAGHTITTDGSLCGTKRRQPHTFVEQWKVKLEHENMFNANFDINQSNPWQHTICSCDLKDEDQGGRAEVTNRIPCNRNSVATCSRGSVVHAHSCGSPRIHRRSIRRNPVIPKVTMSGTSRQIRIKRTTNSNWTEATARSHCIGSMKKSPIYDLCGQVPNVRPSETEENCVADIMLTGGSEWTSLAVDNMQGTCLAELEKNTTLRETNNSTNTSIAQIIEDKACPGNCSDVGLCVKGQCECNPGYGASDCSLDLSIPPTISGLLDHGLCDENTLACDHAYVFGHVFTDTMNLTCKLEEFSISMDGTRTQGTTHYLKGELETLIEVVCPLHQVRRKRSTLAAAGGSSFVVGFSISVSNDGRHFETGHELFVFNSQCQDMQDISGKFHFSLKAGYCFIENQCVPEGGRSQSNNCSVCSRDSSLTAWTADAAQPDCPTIGSEKMDAGSCYLWVIGVVFVVVAGIIIAGVVFVKLKNKRAAKRVEVSSLLMISKPDSRAETPVSSP